MKEYAFGVRIFPFEHLRFDWNFMSYNWLQPNRLFGIANEKPNTRRISIDNMKAVDDAFSIELTYYYNSHSHSHSHFAASIMSLFKFREMLAIFDTVFCFFHSSDFIRVEVYRRISMSLHK